MGVATLTLNVEQCGGGGHQLELDDLGCTHDNEGNVD